MRDSKGPMKQSGDVHPPELDDYDLDGGRQVDEPMAATNEAVNPPMRAAKPSLMQLLPWIVGGLLLYRLIR